MLYGSEFLENCTQVRGLSPRTVVSYADAIADLERVLSIEDPRKITTRDLDHYLSRKFLAGHAASTRATRLAALKSFFRFLYSRGFLDEDPAAAVMPPRVKRGPIPTFTEPEIESMVFRCTPPAITKGPKENDFSFARRRRQQEAKFDRDSALLGLAYSNALRAEEVGKIRNEHFWTDGNGTPALVIMGKAAVEPTRQRVDGAVARLIDRWLARRISLGLVSEYLFCGVTGPGQAHGVSARHVMNVLRARAALVGIHPGKRRVSPHVLRYSRGTHMYLATKDLLLVSAHLRHASIETTVGYIRLGALSAQAKTAVNSLPWNKRGLSDLI